MQCYTNSGKNQSENQLVQAQIDGDIKTEAAVFYGGYGSDRLLPALGYYIGFFLTDRCSCFGSFEAFGRAQRRGFSTNVVSIKNGFITKGDGVDVKLILRAAVWLLSLSFLSGLVLAGAHFIGGRRPPTWLGKLHGFTVSAAISLLTYAWVNGGLGPAGSYGLFALLVAASAGLVFTLGFRSKQKSLQDGLVFAHMSAAFVGILMVFLALLAKSNQ